ETLGFDRNAVTALAPRVHLPLSAPTGARDWRVSPYGPSVTAADLSALHGRGRGMNVVLILLESAGAPAPNSYGCSDDPAPSFPALARRGLTFDDAYSVYPESIKELFGVLCSRYPALDLPAEELAQTTCSPLATSLSKSGYATALFHSGRFEYL